MRPRWMEQREESPSQRAALLPLDAAALLYSGGAWLHRELYRRGALRSSSLSCRVVSVGGLAVGGSGKTPAAAWVARGLRQRGHQVVLASRGHGRRSREPVVVVSDGRFVRSRVENAGDEPHLLAAHAPGVPVLVGRDRAVVGLRAVAAFGAEVLVLDDGFQHHRLERDLEIVTFDGVGGLGNRRVLPRGPLREPVGALALAHAVGVVDGPLPEADESLVQRLVPAALRFVARRRPLGVRPLAGGPLAPASSLAGLEVGIVAGIAGPGSLRRSLEALSARVVAERIFPDHHRYRARDLRDLGREPAVWVTTEKDAVKILPAWLGGADLRVLVIELAVEDGDAFLDWLEVRLR